MPNNWDEPESPNILLTVFSRIACLSVCIQTCFFDDDDKYLFNDLVRICIIMRILRILLLWKRLSKTEKAAEVDAKARKQRFGRNAKAEREIEQGRESRLKTVAGTKRLGSTLLLK